MHRRDPPTNKETRSDRLRETEILDAQCPCFVMSSGVETSLICIRAPARPFKMSRDSSTALGMTRMVNMELSLGRGHPMTSHFCFGFLALTWLVTSSDTFAEHTTL